MVGVDCLASPNVTTKYGSLVPPRSLAARLRPRITETLSSRCLVSDDRRGLVLLLCPGVDDALLALRCELNRWGNANRTIADVYKIKIKKRREKKEGQKSVGRVAWPPWSTQLLTSEETPDVDRRSAGCAPGRSQAKKRIYPLQFPKSLQKQGLVQIVVG